MIRAAISISGTLFGSCFDRMLLLQSPGDMFIWYVLLQGWIELFVFFFYWKKAGFANNVTFSNLISAVTRENQYFVGYLWAICMHTELCHRNVIANHRLQLMMETIQTSPNEASIETELMNHRESAVCSMFNFLKSPQLKYTVVQRMLCVGFWDAVFWTGKRGCSDNGKESPGNGWICPTL